MPTSLAVEAPELHRKRITSRERQRLLDQAGNACQSCGVSTAPLELAHLGADPSDPGQYTVLCPNCHRRLDTYRFREYEFLGFLADLLEASPEFSQVVREPRIGEGSVARPDMIVDRRTGDASLRLLIEVKRWSFLRPQEASKAVQQIRAYMDLVEVDAAALAFPGRLSRTSRDILAQNRIEAWDLDYVASHFGSEIRQSAHEGYRLLYSLAAPEEVVSPSSDLVAKLDACPAGRTHWHDYQQLVRESLELLFAPPLSPPLWESSDSLGVNRRDIIFPNEAQEGFWAFLRLRYGADYVVVDPKNYKGKIKKEQVLQIANYLKPHGTGTFAVIVCRNGEERSATITRREQWAVYGKLIIVLTDEDLEAMLLAHGSGGQPHEVLSAAIQEFRLGM